MKIKNKTGFTLIEILVVIGIIGILATIYLFVFSDVRARANDVKRKTELSQIGKFLTASCYLPDAGAGTYDLVDLFNELTTKEPKYRQLITGVWRDPKSGTDSQSNYTYIVTADKKCALYANLENNNEPITLTNITEPTPGKGAGVFASSTRGVNGTDKYFQVTN